MTPEIFASEVFSIWQQSIEKLHELIEQKPQVSEDLKEKMNQLKEDTIQQLIPFGYAHALLTPELQQACSNRLIMKSGMLASNAAWSVVMNDCFRHYLALSTDISNIISSFNVITQYADYKLLCKQLPQEAARLGILPSQEE
jgi:hypothetical protein